MRRAASSIAALSALLVPAVAAACPYCAGRADGGFARWLILVSFVLFPFVVTAVVLRVIRSGERDDPRPRTG